MGFAKTRRARAADGRCPWRGESRTPTAWRKGVTERRGTSPSRSSPGGYIRAMRTTASYELFPDAPSERAMARARYLVREGRVADAEKAYRQLLAEHPELSPAGQSASSCCAVRGGPRTRYGLPRLNGLSSGIR